MRAAVMDTVIGGRDDAEVFARAKRIGCAGVEITARRLDLRDSNERRLDALRRAKRMTGLNVHALVLGEHNEIGGLADDDTDTAGQARDDVRDATVWAPSSERMSSSFRSSCARISRAKPTWSEPPPRFDRCVRSRPSEA